MTKGWVMVVSSRLCLFSRYPIFGQLQFAHRVVDGDAFRCQPRVQLTDQLAAKLESGQPVIRPHHQIEVDVAVTEGFVPEDGN